MSGYKNALNAYKGTQVKTASQGKLIVMLYDEAIKQINIAVDLLVKNTKQLDKVNTSVTKAQAIVTELLVSLDMERGGDVASNLYNLYIYFNKQLMEGNLKKDADLIKPVANMLSSLREAWVQIAQSSANVEARTGGLNVAG